MPNGTLFTLFLLRISIGWLFFYAGITKVLDPSWSATSYIAHAKTFTGFYTWLASPSILPIINVLNAWGLTLIGVALILGVSVRLAGIMGAVMMLLYYFPILDRGYPNAHAFIVDEHIIYATSLLVVAFADAGLVWGLKPILLKLAFIQHSPLLQWFVR